MAELLDREFQRRLLQEAANVYPAPYSLREMEQEDRRRTLVNASYLEEHGLITFFKGSQGGDVKFGATAKIQAKGIDFLAGDGGLSSILGVVTVRLHEDTLKALVERKIEESSLPQAEKLRFIDQLRQLPAEATKHLVLRLMDAGLDNWQKALPLLQSALS